MTYALCSKAESPSKLTDPRTSSPRSERIHRVIASASRFVGSSTYAIHAHPPSGGTFGNTFCHSNLGPLGHDYSRGSVGVPYGAGSPCGSRCVQLPRRTLTRPPGSIPTSTARSVRSPRSR
jgi:hypothetical protein